MTCSTIKTLKSCFAVKKERIISFNNNNLCINKIKEIVWDDPLKKGTIPNHWGVQLKIQGTSRAMVAEWVNVSINY